MAALYLVGTPIGNLGDMTPRAVETLRQVDFIAAEDTRVSRGLLTHFDIHSELVSYHAHNAHTRGEQILERLLAGQSCAVITDAGMPCISDPGEDLVRLCAQHGVETVVVPGPSAVVSALALSGLATGRFAFEGFLSVQKGSREEHLAGIRDDPRTLIFYEAPHKLAATLRDLHRVLGDRPLSLCRELTKLHEEVVRTTLADAPTLLEAKPARGEYVLVVGGAPPRQPEPPSLEEAVALVLQLRQEGLSLSHAAKEAANRTGCRRSDIYRAALESTGEA